MIKDYTIFFVGLADKKHIFNYKIDKNFFDLFEYSQVKNGKLEVNLELNKQPGLFTLVFNIQGNIWLQCDRCLGVFEKPVGCVQKVILKFSDEKIDNGDDIIFLKTESTEFNISQLIYEYINLMVPFKIVHPVNSGEKSGCDPEVEKILEKVSVNTKNKVDPRWESLSKLLN